MPRFTGKTRITGKTTEIPERPKNNRELKYDIKLFGAKVFCLFIANIIVWFKYLNPLRILFIQRNDKLDKGPIKGPCLPLLITNNNHNQRVNEGK